MRLSLFKTLLLVAGLFCASSTRLVAQGLFTELTDEEAGLSPEQLLKLSTLRQDSLNESIKCISIGSLKDLQQGGKIDFTLPGHNDVLSADPYRIEFEDDSNYSYWAHFKGSEGLGGNMQFTRKDGEYFGRIVPYNTRDIYEIYSLGNAKHTLTKYNINYLDLTGSCRTTGTYVSEPGSPPTSGGVYKNSQRTCIIFPGSCQCSCQH